MPLAPPLGEGKGVGMDLGLEGNTRKLGQTGRIGVFGQDWAAVERWKLAEFHLEFLFTCRRLVLRRMAHLAGGKAGC